jgi:hypothetical protein
VVTSNLEPLLHVRSPLKVVVLVLLTIAKSFKSAISKPVVLDARVAVQETHVADAEAVLAFL